MAVDVHEAEIRRFVRLQDHRAVRALRAVLGRFEVGSRRRSAMADFGNAGTIIVHDSEIAATVDVSNGQFLVCTLDVSGGVASFTFACTHHVLHTPTGPPVSRYQWTVFDEPN